MVHLINCCFDNKYFPLTWKTVIGVPIVKNNFDQNFSDYKYFTWCFKKYVSFQNIIPEIKWRFRSGFNTSTALARFINDIFHTTGLFKGV